MSERKDGGSAFPFIPVDHGGFQEGMTLRDYFAAAALQGFIVRSADIRAFKYHALTAYKYADAMIAEREEK